MKSDKTKRQAFALVLVLTVAAVTSVVLLGIFQSATMEVHAQQNALDMTRAEYLTVAAISHGVAILKDQPNWSGKMTNIRFSQSSSDTYSLVVQRSGQDITIQGSADVEGITEQKTVTMSTDDFEADEKEPEKKDEPTSNVTRFNSDWWRNWVQRLRAAQQRSR